MYDFVPLPQKNSLACCTSSNPMLSHNSAALLVSSVDLVFVMGGTLTPHSHEPSPR